LLGFCGLLAAGGASARASELDKAVVAEKLGATRGICVVLGDRQGAMARDLARASELTLFVQLPNPTDAQAAARTADAAGLYGTRIFVAQGSAARIGLADSLADAVLVLPAALEPPNEIMRVLRPGGRAIFEVSELFAAPEAGQVRRPSLDERSILTKPFPDGVDDWSHHYHGPDNNPQSLDRVARAPYLTQFVAAPRFAPAPQAAVASAGRLFMAFGHIAWHQREEAMMDTLVALNAYNGTVLWQRPLTPGIMVDRSTLIATPATLYLGDDKSCKLLEAGTGRRQDEIVAPPELTDGTCWKWLALDRGTLYALVGAAEAPDPAARWRMPQGGWPWDRISKGYNDPEYRWGFARTLLAIDPATKKVLWHHREDTPMDSRATCMAAGRIYVNAFGRYVACLNAATGRQLWRRTAEKDPDVFQAIGAYRPGHGWIVGWKSTVYLKCTDKALYFAGPQVAGITALSTEDGRVLWKYPAKDPQIVIRRDGLYVVGPQGSKGESKKLDLTNGEVLATYPTCRRACTRSVGTADSIFFRAEEGTGRLDLASGGMRWISATRPSCHTGVIVAGGCLYWVPWVCDCDLQLNGCLCCGPAGEFAFDQPAEDRERLVPAPGEAAPAAFPQSPGDWPTYRGDNARTARSAATVPEAAAVLWRYAAPAPVEPTAPVVAGGLVLVGGRDGIVRAIDAANGRVRWTAYTGGAVFYPPAIAAGRALVGSGDGWVYAFEAASGRQLWRFRAAPVERRIPVFGSLLSTWPAASGVLVDRGTAYVAAGINDFDGTHVYALDAATGRLRWQNNTAGHLDAQSPRGVACQGEMLLEADRLYLAGGNAVSPGIFQASDGRCLNAPPGGNGAKAVRGRELRLTNGRVSVSGQPLYASPEQPVLDKGNAAQSPNALRGLPVVVTAKNAELTCIRRQGPGGLAWNLVARRPGGPELWSLPLPDEPVRWGLAVAADGRVVVTLRSGQVLCCGKPN
jgi:outer membrane protein assembly factor BamB